MSCEGCAASRGLSLCSQSQRPRPQSGVAQPVLPEPETSWSPMAAQAPADEAALPPPRWMRLPADDADRVHRESCRCEPSTCARCIWAENKELWEKRFLIWDDPGRGSWVMGGHYNRKYGRGEDDFIEIPSRPGLGCTICARKSFIRKVGRYKWAHYGITGYVDAEKLEKHARSRLHKGTLNDEVFDRYYERADSEERTKFFMLAEYRVTPELLPSKRFRFTHPDGDEASYELKADRVIVAAAGA